MLTIMTKVKFKKGHPHSGETGTVIRHNFIMGKKRNLVRLDDCKHGVSECYAMNEKDIEII